MNEAIRARGEALRAELAERFPEAFKPKGALKTPLKVGIHRDIQAMMPEVPAREIRAALANYTGGPTYLRNLKPGAQRIGLSGELAGEVGPDQAQVAKVRLKAMNKHWDKKERQQQRREKPCVDNTNSQTAIADSLDGRKVA